MTSSSWITCGGCGLQHSTRADARCPRCGHTAGAGASSSAAASPGYSAPPPYAGAGAAHFSSPAPALEEGSSALGFVLGFFLGLWGLIGCFIFGKAATKRGAGYGFVTRLGLTFLVVALAVCAGGFHPGR